MSTKKRSKRYETDFESLSPGYFIIGVRIAEEKVVALHVNKRLKKVIIFATDYFNNCLFLWKTKSGFWKKTRCKIRYNYCTTCGVGEFEARIGKKMFQRGLKISWKHWNNIVNNWLKNIVLWPDLNWQLYKNGL